TSHPRNLRTPREIPLVMRAIWKGSISFGLVNIPIALYPATRKEELKFRLLRQKDLSPINYKRVAEKDGKEVPWDEIVKGYEYEKGKFVILKDEDFQRVDLEATQTVDIQDFVDVDEIDPMYFAEELADASKLGVPKKLEPQKKEMDMAKALINSMSSKWSPEKYHDDYREAVMKVIEEKVEHGGEDIEEKPRKAPKPTKVID